MKSREIVRRTLEFQNPERVAKSFGDSDLVGVEHTVKTYATKWEKISEKKWQRKDDWGNIWQRIDKSSKGEVSSGVLEKLEDIDDYVFPDFSDLKFYEKAKKIREENKDKWVMGLIPGFTFNIARKFLKLDKYFVDIMVNKEGIRKLHDKIDKVLQDIINGYAYAGCDCIFFWEDWGTQTQTLMSPKLWEEEFYPRTKGHCELAHSKGMKVFMHSCGKITEIVPGLMEAGIDLFQFDQPELHGIDNLAAYQDNNKISFWCPVDIQKTLQTKDEEAIRKAAKEMIDKLWKRKGGGFIAGYYEDNESIGLDEKWQGYACDEFIKQGQ